MRKIDISISAQRQQDRRGWLDLRQNAYNINVTDEVDSAKGKGISPAF
jgi:hypothetical protein